MNTFINLLVYTFIILVNSSEIHDLFPRINNTESYENGAVSTENPLCSKIGIEILKEGGNAVDSAICSAICVGIINSFSSGIGGGGFMIIKSGKNENKEKVEIVDFREVAPEEINKNNFDRHLSTQRGGLSVGVPGEIKGYMYAHQKYGKLPWKKLFEKNIKLAKKFEVSDQLSLRLEKLKDYIFADPSLKEIYTRNNELVKEGDTISRENLANTLKIISENPSDFYEGELAERIVESIKEHGGKMSLDDLKNYEVKQRRVIKGTYKNFQVITSGLPSGGLFIIQALNILENFDLVKLKAFGEDNNIYPHYHVLAETMKFVAANRGLLGDPEFSKDVDIVDKIISKETAKEIARKIDLNTTQPLSNYEPTDFAEDHGTTHLNVIDSNNMVVLITSSVNLEFGAKFMDPVTGIIFNDVIDDFYIPNVTNAYGLEKMPSNIIEPKKRPFSSASPVILINDNEILALGAAGGTRIPTSVLGVIFHLVLGKTLNEAIMEPRIHHQLLPNFIFIENTLNPDISKYLESLGHKLKVSKTNTIFTSVQGLHAKIKGTRKIQVFSDARKGGLADGY